MFNKDEVIKYVESYFKDNLVDIVRITMTGFAIPLCMVWALLWYFTYSIILVILGSGIIGMIIGFLVSWFIAIWFIILYTIFTQYVVSKLKERQENKTGI